MRLLDYTHVDVFAEAPFAGNSLPVFVEPGAMTYKQMLQVTQELRHFEAVFLQATSEPYRWRARVFDLFTELPFAGHPLLGAVAVLHRAADETSTEPSPSRSWSIELGPRTVELRTRRSGGGFHADLDQGQPAFTTPEVDLDSVARAFGLAVEDLHQDLPIDVVSTGLRYLIVPVGPGVLPRARIATDITALVQSATADFAVLFDESELEIRHWNNDGVVEDIATGSAAGTIGAYRMRYGLVGGEPFRLSQGRFTGRPSRMSVQAHGTTSVVDSVSVGGPVAFVGAGHLCVPS